MTVSYRPDVQVTIGDRTVDAASVSVSSDSPLDLHLPPKTGGIAGGDARVNLAPTSPVAHGMDMPWSPTFRAHPGDEAQVTIDGTRVFTGIVDDTDIGFHTGTVNTTLVDPLAGYDKTFSAPATLKTLPPLPGSSNVRRCGANSFFYLDHALTALGVHSTTPVVGRTDMHASMCGTLHPTVGSVLMATTTAWGGGPLYPVTEPIWRPMSGGRIGAVNPYVHWLARSPAPSAPTVGTWHLTHEVDPTQDGTVRYQVRTRTPGGKDGFGLWVRGDRMRVLTWDTDGVMRPATYRDQGQTLIDLPLEPTTERVLVVYHVIDKYLEVRRLAADGTDDAIPFQFSIVGAPPAGHTVTRRQLEVLALGLGLVGAVSLMSRSSKISAVDNPYISTPRGVTYDMSPLRLVRRSMRGHPPVQDEPAVAWINHRVAEHRAFLRTDRFGVVHISDPADWPTLPVTHTVTDGLVAGDVTLDDLQVTVARKQAYSRVRTVGTRVLEDIGWGPGRKPNRLCTAVNEEVTLQAGDDPVEYELEPRSDHMFWVGDVDLDLRYAGEPVTQPWHLEDDFARGRGSWGGGHVRDVETGEVIRWALSTEWGQIVTNPRPADVLYEVEQTAPDRIHLVIKPGPGLGPGEEYVNLPSPTSASLVESNKDRLVQYLPVFRGPAVGRFAETDAVSADITPDVAGWGDLDEYVHEAGLSVQSTGQGGELAQIMADSHTNDFGQVTVDVALDPAVQIGDRIHVLPRSRADVTLDGVVTGIPAMAVDVGAPRMTLTVWVLDVHVHSITNAERNEIARQSSPPSGNSYGYDLFLHFPETYDQEAGRHVDTRSLYPRVDLYPSPTLYPSD